MKYKKKVKYQVQKFKDLQETKHQNKINDTFFTQHILHAAAVTV